MTKIKLTDLSFTDMSEILEKITKDKHFNWQIKLYKNSIYVVNDYFSNLFEGYEIVLDDQSEDFVKIYYVTDEFEKSYINGLIIGRDRYCDYLDWGMEAFEKTVEMIVNHFEHYV